jgi:hypothetical protein
MLRAFLAWQRATLLYKCAGLTGEQLAERTVPPSALSLLGLVRHMTKVERAWFRQRFAGEPVDNPFGDDEDADFDRGDPARAAADYARLTEEFKLADTAVANASLDDTFMHNGETMSLRLIYLHMIEEYARHLGHADLLRERIDGATGELPGRGAPDPIQSPSRVSVSGGGLRSAPGVDGAGTQRPGARVGLQSMGNPSCRPRHGEDRLPGAPDHSCYPGHGGDGEVDVRCGQGLPLDLGQDGLGHRELRRFRRGAPDQIEQQGGARVAGPVHEVAEPGHLLSAPQQFAHDPRAVFGAAGRGQQRFGAERRPAVQRAAHRPHPGRDHGVGIGPNRRRDPGGQRGGGKLVVGQQHQGC